MAKESVSAAQEDALVRQAVRDSLLHGVSNHNAHLKLEAGTIGLFYTHPAGEYLEQIARHHANTVDELFPMLIDKAGIVVTKELEEDVVSVATMTKRLLRDVLVGQDILSSMLIHLKDPDHPPSYPPRTYCLVRPAVRLIPSTGEVAVFTHIAYRHCQGADKDQLFAARRIMPGRHFGRSEAVVRSMTGFSS